MTKFRYIYYAIILGAYVPITVDGNIIVNGVLASCHASFNNDLAHFMMKPVSWFPEAVEWIFGVGTVSPVFVSLSKELARWILPKDHLFGFYF